MDEANFIERLKSGKEDAFKKLVEDYQSMVINTCFGFLHNLEEAEDIAQEVFIQVYKRIATFRGEAKLSTWIYRIAVNKSLNSLRSRKTKLMVAIDSIFESGEAYGQTPTTPYKTLENKERAMVLHDAIDKLPENQKTAFVLSKYRSLPNKKIALVMDLSLSAVEALLNRAKKNLQKSLIGYYKNQKK